MDSKKKNIEERLTCTKIKCKSFLKINNLNNIEECSLEYNHDKGNETYWRGKQ
jgi:hypothetical protein